MEHLVSVRINQSKIGYQSNLVLIISYKDLKNEYSLATYKKNFS